MKSKPIKKELFSLFEGAEIPRSELIHLKGGTRFSCACGNGSGFSADVGSAIELYGLVQEVCGGSGAHCDQL